MPHFVLDCSESVLAMVDPKRFMQAVYEVAETTGLFAATGVGGIKVRINPYTRYLNVDGQEHFVHVFAHILEGRSTVQKRELSEAVVRAIKGLLPQVEIISMNVREFERATYCNVPMLRSAQPAG